MKQHSTFATLTKTVGSRSRNPQSAITDSGPTSRRVPEGHIPNMDKINKLDKCRRRQGPWTRLIGYFLVCVVHITYLLSFNFEYSLFAPPFLLTTLLHSSA